MLANLLHETEEYHIDRIFPSLIICPAFYFLRDLKQLQTYKQMYTTLPEKAF